MSTKIKLRGGRFNRRYPMLVITLLSLLGLVWLGQQPRDGLGVASFNVAPEVWVPYVPSDDILESTWFCPGVPATGETDVGGAVIVTNTSDQPTSARVTFLSDTAAARTKIVDVPAFDRVQVDVDAEQQGTFVATSVEILGGGGLVEQRAFYPASAGLGQSVTPCSINLSSEWYLAEGYTVDLAEQMLLLSNPSADQVVVDVSFHTASGMIEPSVYNGLPVQPYSVRVIDVGVEGGGARGEESVGVSVRAARGALMVGRSMTADDDRRGGTSISMAAPLLADRWWFADGVKSPQASERFSVLNPTDEAVTVLATFFLSDNVEDVAGEAVTSVIEVASRDVAVIDAGALAELPEGDHSAVFSTLDGRSIVVDRALTRVSPSGVKVTSIASGVPERRDGLAPMSWLVAAGPSVEVESGLVVVNLDDVDREVSLSTFGSNGLVAVEGSTQMRLPAASRIVVDLKETGVLGRPIAVESTGRLLVERRVPSSDAFSSAWAIAGMPCC